jgi:hypothetical protein
LKDDLSKEQPTLSGKEVFVVIWTTTPWTLPANLGIALHPDFEYVAVDVGGGEVYILARDLVEACMQSFGITDYSVACIPPPATAARITKWVWLTDWKFIHPWITGAALPMMWISLKANLFLTPTKVSTPN